MYLVCCDLRSALTYEKMKRHHFSNIYSTHKIVVLKVCFKPGHIGISDPVVKVGTAHFFTVCVWLLKVHHYVRALFPFGELISWNLWLSCSQSLDVSVSANGKWAFSECIFLTP